MGVAMLPRLAAIVSNTTRERTEPFWLTPRVTSRVKGTKVIKVTSLVMTILLKKHSSVRAKDNPRNPPARRSHPAAETPPKSENLPQ